MIRYSILLLTCFLLVSCGGTAPGEVLPEFKVTTMDGTEYSNESLKGKIAVINIFATWCRPCIMEMPELNALYAKYKDDPEVVFLAITDDPRRKIDTFLSKRAFDYPIATDAGDTKKKFYTGIVETIPKSVITNKEGVIVFEMVENIWEVEKTLSEQIEKLKAGN